MTYLNDLKKQHNVFIYRNVRKCILSLYKNKQNKTIVEAALRKSIENLAVSTFNIELNDKISTTAYHAAYRRIVKKLGKTAARLNVTTSPKTITIDESSQDVVCAIFILREESGQVTATKDNIEANFTRAVC